MCWRSPWLGIVVLACTLGAASGCTDTPALDGESTSTSSEDSSTDTGEDAGTSASECDMYAQDCPEGEKCAWVWVDAGSAHHCVPVVDSAELGQPCSHDGVVLGTDSCDAGGMCYGPFSLTEGWAGVCTAFCAGTSDAPVCDADQVCTLGNIPVCLVACDPLLQDCAGEGETCWYSPNANDFVCSLSSSASGLAEPCIAASDCVEGLTCVEGSTVFGCTDPGCCAPFCDLGEANTCPDASEGVECVDLMVGGVHASVGVCMLPP